MRILLQQVQRAAVAVDCETIGDIGRGVLLLVGFGAENAAPKLQAAADKIIHLRIFPATDASAKLEHSLLDIGGEILLIPQFTLYALTNRGRRPDFSRALSPKLAAQHFDELLKLFQQTSAAKVAAGKFGADMQISLVNDGPFTLSLEF